MMPFWATLLVPPLVSSAVVRVVRVMGRETRGVHIEPDGFDERWIVYGLIVEGEGYEGSPLYDEEVKVSIKGSGVNLRIPLLRAVSGIIVPVVSFSWKGNPLIVSVENGTDASVSVTVVLLALVAGSEGDYARALSLLGGVKGRVGGV